MRGELSWESLLCSKVASGERVAFGGKGPVRGVHGIRLASRYPPVECIMKTHYVIVCFFPFVLQDNAVYVIEHLI